MDGPPDPITRKRRAYRQGGFASKALAVDSLNRFRHRLTTGQVVDDQGQTITDWLRHWLAEGAAGWEPSTLTGYTDDCDLYLIPALGHLRLRDLTRAHVSEMLAGLGKVNPAERRAARGKRGGSSATSLSASSIDRVRRTLRSALSAAVEDERISLNPAAGRFRRIGKRTRVQEVAWWQPEQLQAFLGFVADDPDVALWTVTAFTGLRRGELGALRWVDVDLTSDQPGITIRQKLADISGPRVCPVCGLTHQGRQLRPGAKSRAGTYRWVPLTSSSVAELLAHQVRQEARAKGLGDHWSDHGLVFPLDAPSARDKTAPGAPRRPDAITKRHGELVAAAGLPRIVLHEMRHGAISLLAAAGLSAELIALIVGHASEEVTNQVYMHAIKSQLSTHAEQAQAMVTGPAPATGGTDPVP